jgi:23S rRNA (guanosine2251-2'-O)-methyltransferase
MIKDTSPNVVYGIHAVEELLKNRSHEVDRVYFESDRTSAPLFNLLKICRKQRLSCQHMPASTLDEIAQTSKHQGVAAVCSIKAYSSVEDLDKLISETPAPPLLFVPASVEDPRNLGSLIRSCVAFGVTAMLLERKNTALLGSTVAKTAAGMMEHIPIVKPKNLEGLIQGYKAKGFRIIGAQHEGNILPEEADLTGPLVIITGGENRDIPPYLLKICTHIVRIPISPLAQSLNVSVAGAIILYECTRQRRASTLGAVTK